jgi:hypothetical protein
VDLGAGGGVCPSGTQIAVQMFTGAGTLTNNDFMVNIN